MVAVVQRSILLLYLPPLQLFDLRWFESKHQFSSSSQVDCKPLGAQKVTWQSANLQTTVSHLYSHCIVESRKLASFYEAAKCRQLSVNYAERC